MMSEQEQCQECETVYQYSPESPDCPNGCAQKDDEIHYRNNGDDETACGEDVNGGNIRITDRKHLTTCKSCILQIITALRDERKDLDKDIELLCHRLIRSEKLMHEGEGE